MADASTDTGTVLPPNGWAVMWQPDKGWSLLVPETHPDRRVPKEGMAITAVMLRLEREPEFVDEMAQWFKEQGKQ